MSADTLNERPHAVCRMCGESITSQFLDRDEFDARGEGEFIEQCGVCGGSNLFERSEYFFPPSP
jgi:hypothetical protein